MSNKAGIQNKLSLGIKLPPDFQWAKPSINFLINTVENYFEDFYDKTLKKKVLWKKIAAVMNQEGFACSAEECDKKWRNLKKTYVTVLQKQVQLDFSSKFAYFEKMHSFIGKEVDPLGMREQRLKKAIIERKAPLGKLQWKDEYNELTSDGNFQWDDTSVLILLNEILKKKDKFKMASSRSTFNNSHIDSIWQEIYLELRMRGYMTDNIMCQKKWCNLAACFRYHQAAAEKSGIFPDWMFFGKVRQVINTLNVLVTIVEDKQYSPESSSNFCPDIEQYGCKAMGRARQTIKNESIEITENDEGASISIVHAQPSDDDSGITGGQFKSLMSAVNKLNRSLDVEGYYNDLQKRLELVDRISRSTAEENDKLRDIQQSLKNCNRILADTEIDNSESFQIRTFSVWD